ncbi:MAG: fumarate hydratase [Chitinispirillales bacterium]|jgi:fumarate hydratase subunit alpha|nr:fumarate hydratase [Chitinispirillales bacterium]
MKTIQYPQIVESVSDMCVAAACDLPEDIWESIKKARVNEPFPRAQEILDQILENAFIAQKERIPICQDTGYAVYFVKIGDDVKIEDGTLSDAINEGTAKGYTKGNLRGSIVNDPLFDRKNTGNNTPAMIHVDIVDGGALQIDLLPKGGGCENMSRLAMLKPSDGLPGVKKFVKESVVSAGGNPCPPVIVGVGVGGTADGACVLAKKALLRPAGVYHNDQRYAALEHELFEEINASGVGPQGLGGMHTALGVFIEYLPCHIASLPVAVSLNCHAARRMSVIL